MKMKRNLIASALMAAGILSAGMSTAYAGSMIPPAALAEMESQGFTAEQLAAVEKAPAAAAFLAPLWREMRGACDLGHGQWAKADVNTWSCEGAELKGVGHIDYRLSVTDASDNGMGLRAKATVGQHVFYIAITDRPQ